jgi:hypothetical protein
MKRTVLTFGLGAGVIVSALMMLHVPFSDRISFELGVLIGYTSMVLAFLLIYFGVRSYREQTGGRIGFFRALGLGSMIALVGSLCYVAAWQVVYFNFMPDYLTRYQETVLEQARAEGHTPAQIAAQRAEMEQFAARYQEPAFNAAVTLMEPLPVGLVIALVTAGVLSRARRTEAEEPALAAATAHG